MAPYIYLKGKKEFLTKILSFTKVQISPLLILFLCTIFFMLFNGLIVEWNKNIEFPSFLSSFEEYAKSRELELEKLTLFLVSFENFYQYLLGIIAVAIIPAFCEEYLFRGVIQKKLEVIFNNFFALSLFYFSYSGAIDLSVEEVNNYQFPFFFSLFSLLGSLYFFRLFYLNFLSTKK